MCKFNLSKTLRMVLVGMTLATGVVGAMTVAPPQAHAEYVLVIYGPYPTAAARNAAAGTGSWTGDYVNAPPPGVPGVRVAGYSGPGYYFWYN
jgi:hypothetical protein